MVDFKHYTVMKNEAVDALECESGKIYVDCTLGGGGHSELILQRIAPDGKLFAFDIDDDAISFASERLKQYNNLTIIKDSYVNIKSQMANYGIEKITGGVILDLGASYHQLTKAERGFSFMKDAPLDMRFNMTSDFTAYDVVNAYVFLDAKYYVNSDFLANINTSLQTNHVITGAVNLICKDELSLIDNIKYNYNQYKNNFIQKSRATKISY